MAFEIERGLRQSNLLGRPALPKEMQRQTTRYRHAISGVIVIDAVDAGWLVALGHCCIDCPYYYVVVLD